MRKKLSQNAETVCEKLSAHHDLTAVEPHLAAITWTCIVNVDTQL